MINDLTTRELSAVRIEFLQEIKAKLIQRGIVPKVVIEQYFKRKSNDRRN